MEAGGKNKRGTALILVTVIYEAIKEAGSEGIPSGHLYSMIMDKVSLEIYQEIISVLKDVGKITDSHHLLTAV